MYNEKRGLYSFYLRSKNWQTEEKLNSARMEARTAVRVAKKETDKRKEGRPVENFREGKKRFWMEVKGARKGKD